MPVAVLRFFGSPSTNVIGGVALPGIALFLGCQASMAALTPAETNYFISMLATDSDYSKLPVLFGLDTIQNPLSTGMCSDTAWSSSIGGSYLGNPLDFGYSGTLTGNTINWTGAGTLGSMVFVSSATGSISGTTISIAGSASLGAHSWSWSGAYAYDEGANSLHGFDDGLTDGLASPGEFFASVSGSWGPPNPPLPGYTWRKQKDPLSKSGWEWFQVDDRHPNGPIAVPEPAAIGLLSIASLAMLRRRREPRKQPLSHALDAV